MQHVRAPDPWHAQSNRMSCHICDVECASDAKDRKDGTPVHLAECYRKVPLTQTSPRGQYNITGLHREGIATARHVAGLVL